MCSLKLDIYQSALATQIVLRVTQTLDVLIFFKKKVLPDVQSEIHLAQRNIASTGQCV